MLSDCLFSISSAELYLREVHVAAFSFANRFSSVLFRQIMRRLLDKGADIHAKTTDGDTPLSLAVSSGSVGSVGFLVKAGAALDLVDKVGQMQQISMRTMVLPP